MAIESPNTHGRKWRDGRGLILVEFALVVAVYVARQHHILKFSATPYLLFLAWISLRLRGVHWKDIGFTRYRTWKTTLLHGIVCGVGLELFDLFGKQPFLTRLLGKPPDLSSFPAVRGNLKLALVMIALIWILAAFGEELVYRGYLMNRVADLGSGTRTAWIVSLFLTSAVFGFSHYQQGLTGIIEEGSDGLILGLMYPCLSPQPRHSRCRPRSLRYHRYRPAFLGQVSRPVEASRIANVFSPTFSCLVLRSTIMLGIFCHPPFLFRSTEEAVKDRFHSLTERQVV